MEWCHVGPISFVIWPIFNFFNVGKMAAPRITVEKNATVKASKLAMKFINLKQIPFIFIIYINYILKLNLF